MSDRAPATGLLWLLGLPFLGLALGLPSAPPKAEARAAPQEPGSAPGAEELPSPLDRCRQRAEDLLAAGARVQALIATLPDPADSLHSRLFDSLVESIRRGTQSAGYVEGGACLAWSRGDGDRSVDPLHRREPGWLLFQRGGPASGATAELLVVLLVGESPPWGVHAAAFGKALDRACSLSGGDRAPGERRSPKLLGPTFSGSAPSLGVALRRWSDRDPAGAHGCLGDSLEVVSGTATAAGNAAAITAALAAEKEEGTRFSIDVAALRFVLQSEKDPLLSLLGGTEANQLNWHRSLFERLSLFAGLPTLSLVTSQFPELQRLVAGWLEPLARVFQ